MPLSKPGPAAISPTNNLAALPATVREALAETERLATAEIIRKQDDIRYRQMFENNSAVKLLIDPTTGAIVDANDAACRFYGYSRADLTNLNINADKYPFARGSQGRNGESRIRPAALL